jgi:hypothetical protein
MQNLILILPPNRWLAFIQAIFSFSFATSGGMKLKCPFYIDGYTSMLTKVMEQMALAVLLLLLFLFSLLCRFILLLLCRGRRTNGNIQSVTDDDENSDSSDSSGDNVMESLNVVPKDRYVYVDQTETKYRAKLRSMFFTTDAYLLSLVQVLIVTYQGITQSAFTFFGCNNFGHETSRLVEHTNIVCYTSEYWKWSILYFPLIVYALVFPIAIIVFLRIFRSRLFTESFSERFGALYSSYRPELYWFEGVALLRRTIIVGAAMLLSKFGNQITMFILGLLFGLFLVVNRVTKPFSISIENHLEEMSLLTLLLVNWIEISAFKEGARMIMILICIIPVSIVLIVYFIIVNPTVLRLRRKSIHLFNRLRNRMSHNHTRDIPLTTATDLNTSLLET